MITEFLHWLGVSGQIIMLAMLATGLLHFKSVLDVGRTAASWSRSLAVIVAILVIGMTGIVPGFSVAVDVGVIGDVVGWAWQALPVEELIGWLFS